MIAETVVLGVAGLAAGGSAVWTEIRAAWALRGPLAAEPRLRMRRQIRAQYWADFRVCRELTLDPWLGLGGRFLFDPSWQGMRMRSGR